MPLYVLWEITLISLCARSPCICVCVPNWIMYMCSLIDTCDYIHVCLSINNFWLCSLIPRLPFRYLQLWDRAALYYYCMLLSFSTEQGGLCWGYPSAGMFYSVCLSVFLSFCLSVWRFILLIGGARLWWWEYFSLSWLPPMRCPLCDCRQYSRDRREYLV